MHSQFVEKVCFSKKVLVLNPYPQTPFPWKGAECGAAALTPLGATPQTPFLKLYRFFDNLAVSVSGTVFIFLQKST